MLSSEDLTDLAARLRAAEFQPSAHQLITARRLIVALEERKGLPVSRRDLAASLGPVFCSNPGEQARFVAVFEDWLASRFGERAPEPPVLPEPPPSPWERVKRAFGVATPADDGRAARPRWHGALTWAAVALAVVVVGLACWTGWQHFRVDRELVVVVRLDGVPKEGAWVVLGEGDGKTDKDGRIVFRVRAATLPRPLAVSLTRDGKVLTDKDRQAGAALARHWTTLYLGADPRRVEEIVALATPDDRVPPPIAVEDKPVRTLQGPVTFTLSPETPQWLDRIRWHAAWPFAVAAGVLLLWCLYRILTWALTRHPGLRRIASETPRGISEVRLPGGVRDLVPDIPFRQLAREMRRRLRVDSRELQVEPTIRASVARGGVFTPVYGSLVEPDYVVLLDRACAGDHVARLADEMTLELARADVKLACFDFRGSPARCRPLGDERELRRHGPAQWLAGARDRPFWSLAEIRRRFGAHRLLIVTDGREVFDPYTGVPRAWVDALLEWSSVAGQVSGVRWPAPVLLTPVPLDRWGRREWALQRLGLILLPLDHKGVLRLVARLGGSPSADHEHAASDRRLVHERDAGLWLDLSPPHADTVEDLVRDLRADLGPQGMDWLCACAAYPEIHWGITLRLGRALVPDAAREAALLRLARLVWLREAYMPDWLRERLLAELAPQRDDEVRRLLLAMLEHVGRGDERELPLVIATERTRWAPWQRVLDRFRAWRMVAAAPERSPLRDHVFLEFLAGRRRTDLSVSPGSAGRWRGRARWQRWVDAAIVSSSVGAMAALGLWDLPYAPGEPGVQILDARFSPKGDRLLALQVDTVGSGDRAHAYRVAVVEQSPTAVEDRTVLWSHRLYTVGAAGAVGLPTSGSISADGMRVSLTSADGVTVLAGNALRPVRLGSVRGPTILDASGQFALIAEGAWAVLLDAPTHAVVYRHPEFSDIVSTDLTRAGRRAALGFANAAVTVSLMPDQSPAGSNPAVAFFPYKGSATAVAFDPEGQSLAVGGRSGNLTVLGVTDRFLSERGSVELGPGAITSLAWSADGRRLAASVGRSLQVRDAGTLQPAARGELAGTGDPRIAGFSSDGTLLAVSERGGRLHVFALPSTVPSAEEQKKAEVERPPLPDVVQTKKPEIPPPPPDPKEILKACPTCPEMAIIPAGDFFMGSTEGLGDPDESPKRRVTVERFAMSRTEVTFDQWDACVKAGGCKHRPEDRGWGRGNRPVIHVSWADAQEYVTWLAKETGQPYRLPSEAEWEYAAQADSTTKYAWGDRIGKGLANCDLCGSPWDNKQTAPVGSFQANKFGLYDMHGNVWEWVQDCWNDSYRGAPDKALPPWTRGDCSRRVVRGGSWNYVSVSLRSASRNMSGTEIRNDHLGFRVARTLP